MGSLIPVLICRVLGDFLNVKLMHVFVQHLDHIALFTF